jgi:hypothetical protein
MHNMLQLVGLSRGVVRLDGLVLPLLFDLGQTKVINRLPSATLRKGGASECRASQWAWRMSVHSS